MHVVDISQFENSVTLHFDAPTKSINAYTLASILVSLADAAKAANITLNSGCEIEIIVETLGPGSFRASIRALYTNARNLLANQILLPIIISIISSYIYERAFSVDNTITVEIKTDEVIFKKGDEQIIVPRNVYDATREAEKNPTFVKAMTSTFQAIADDKKIKSLGLVPTIDAPPPEISIPRSTLRLLAASPPETPDSRVITEEAELQIVKAILQRSKRKWEFVWRGVTISAPVTDESFYTEFTAHKITIAPGDKLKVTLVLKQNKDPKFGVYTNTSYEVSKVHEHIPRCIN